MTKGYNENQPYSLFFWPKSLPIFFKFNIFLVAVNNHVICLDNIFLEYISIGGIRYGECRKKGSKQEVKKVETAQVLSPFEEMERMFDNYFSRGWMRQFHTDWPPFSRLANPLKEKHPVSMSSIVMM